MKLNIKQVTTPQSFFDHELDNLRADTDYSILKFFAFTDENGKYINKNLYIAYNPNDTTNRYGEDVFIMKKMIEKRYSQSIIDASRERCKKNGTKSYEWYYDAVDIAIDAETGEEIYEVESKSYRSNYLYVYGNLIVETGGNSRHRIVNKNGDVLWAGDTGYSDLHVTENHIVIKTNHDYRTNIDTVLVFDKLTGEQIAKY